MIRSLPIAGLVLLSPVAHGALGADADPLARLSDERIDIELVDAPVKDVLSLVGDIIQRPLTVDDCVQGAVNLKLHNATVQMTLAAIAANLDLVYETGTDGNLAVGCTGRRQPKGTKVSLQLPSATPRAAFDTLARSQGATANVSNCDDRRVDLELENAPVAAVVRGLATELGAHASWEGSVLQVVCR